MAQPTADSVKRMAERIMVLFRPKRSLSAPAKSTPMIEPTKAHPTYHPLCSEVSENWVETCETVPEITAVSYPNRKPPKAATTERKVT